MSVVSSELQELDRLVPGGAAVGVQGFILYIIYFIYYIFSNSNSYFTLFGRQAAAKFKMHH